jgi:site-specific recombinase XerD
MRKTSFSISRVRVHGSLRFCVTFPRPDGPGRVRRFFEKKPEAESFLSLKKQEATAHGVRSFSLSEQDRADFLWAKQQLAPYGLSVRKAVESLLPQLKAREHTLTVEEAVRRVIETKSKAGMSERHIETLESRLGKFATDHPNRALSSFTLKEVESWLSQLPVGPQTANNIKASLHSLFAHAVKLGACLANPVSGIDPRKVVRDAPSILTPTQFSNLLTACESDSEMLAFVAISGFAGLRRAELERLQWEDVNISRGFITVGAVQAKTSRRRLIPICSALKDWLAPIAKARGPVGPQVNFRRRFDKVRVKAGLAENWEGNELRHSFATYRLAETADAARTALELGNSPAVLFQHYAELATPDEATAWFLLKPAADRKVVSFAA